MEQPVVKQIKNGWHAESATQAIAVRGDTPDEARRLFVDAVKKAAELRARPLRFANPS